jgi:hypothetical protein
MAEDIFSKGIGNKEQKSLEAKPVVVQGKIVEPVLGKAGGKNAGKEVGKKLVLICKHPDRQEPVSIASIVIVSGKTIKNSTLWVNLDEEGNLQKGSPIAILLQKYGASTLNELDGKVLQTEVDESKFLTIKGY